MDWEAIGTPILPGGVRTGAGKLRCHLTELRKKRLINYKHIKHGHHPLINNSAFGNITQRHFHVVQEGHICKYPSTAVLFVGREGDRGGRSPCAHRWESTTHQGWPSSSQMTDQTDMRHQRWTLNLITCQGWVANVRSRMRHTRQPLTLLISTTQSFTFGSSYTQKDTHTHKLQQ